MMTDERCGERLWPALDRLPEGCGIVFRHYRTAQAVRYAMAHGIAQLARARGLFLSIAGDAALAEAVGASAAHNPRGPAGALPVSRSAHSIAEAVEAGACGTGLVFVSPVYATRSHPEAPPLGLEKALEIARASGLAAIALGGMNASRGAKAIDSGFHGWAAIDAWYEALE